MSDTVYFVGTLISVLAAVGSLWSAIRRRQIAKRILDSLTPEQRAELDKRLKQKA